MDRYLFNQQELLNSSY